MQGLSDATGKKIAELMARYLEENKRLYEKLEASKTPAERKELYGSIRFNSYLLGVLTRLTTGRIGEVPEQIALYETR